MIPKSRLTGRKGISPVVAIVLLLMMTIAVAGGAFAWVNGILGPQMGRGNVLANTDVNFRASCTPNAGGSADVSFSITNVGDVELDASNAVMHLNNLSGAFVETSSPASAIGTVSVGGQASGTVTFTNDLAQGARYTLEFEFPSQAGYTVSTQCTAD